MFWFCNEILILIYCLKKILMYFLNWLELLFRIVLVLLKDFSRGLVFRICFVMRLLSDLLIVVRYCMINLVVFVFFWFWFFIVFYCFSFLIFVARWRAVFIRRWGGGWSFLFIVWFWFFISWIIFFF